MTKKKSITGEAIDWAIIVAYCKARRRPVSGFLIDAGLNEINRHTRKNGLIALIDAGIRSVLQERFPTQGEADGYDLR